MIIRTLRVDGVRNLRDVVIEPDPGFNLFVGDNGAGKTSLLEALHIPAVGRSFRSGSRTAWIARGREQAEIFLATDTHRIGLAQGREGWTGRVDGQSVDTRAELSRWLPVVTFHPESHALIDGQPENRRRLVDLGLFHVEPLFLKTWRHYVRALRQRNGLLRQSGRPAELRIWEKPMVEMGGALTAFRADHARALGHALSAILEVIAPDIPVLNLSWYSGWPEDLTFQAALDRARDTDRDRGFTSVGPQRADLRIRDSEGQIAGRYSRGQQKLVALALLLAQARLLSDALESSPIIAVDDLPSELDAAHQERLVGWLEPHEWQVWVTGTTRPAGLKSGRGAMFHVEQGGVRPVL